MTSWQGPVAQRERRVRLDGFQSRLLAEAGLYAYKGISHVVEASDRAGLSKAVAHPAPVGEVAE